MRVNWNWNWICRKNISLVVIWTLLWFGNIFFTIFFTKHVINESRKWLMMKICFHRQKSYWDGINLGTWRSVTLPQDVQEMLLTFFLRNLPVCSHQDHLAWKRQNDLDGLQMFCFEWKWFVSNTEVDGKTVWAVIQINGRLDVSSCTCCCFWESRVLNHLSHVEKWILSLYIENIYRLKSMVPLQGFPANTVCWGLKPKAIFQASAGKYWSNNSISVQPLGLFQ